MISGDVNLLSVLVASVVSMIVGYVWYAPGVFGKQWMELTKVKPKKDGVAKSVVLGFVTTLIMIYVFANVMMLADITSVAGGLSAGLTLWVGFVATITLGSVIWEQRPVKLWVINAGHWLINFLIIGIILGAWM